MKACCRRIGGKNSNKHIVAIAIDEDDEVHSVTECFLFINLINRRVYEVVCDSRYICWSSSGDNVCISVSQKILQCPFGVSVFLKHHQYFSQPFKLGRNLFR